LGKHNGFLEYDWRRIRCGNGNELFKNLKWITGDRSLIRAIYINFLVETDCVKIKNINGKRLLDLFINTLLCQQFQKRKLLIENDANFSSEKVSIFVYH